jgi:hypothetical protein
VGQPGRAIASVSGAVVTGITINNYQIKRAEIHTRKVGYQLPAKTKQN